MSSAVMSITGFSWGNNLKHILLENTSRDHFFDSAARAHVAKLFYASPRGSIPSGRSDWLFVPGTRRCFDEL